MIQSLIQSFSDSYDIIPQAEVLTHSGAAIMDDELYDVLTEVYGDVFIGRVENERYNFEPTRQIPAMTVAVPEDKHGVNDPGSLLIKNG
jgi:hypothetical protein